MVVTKHDSHTLLQLGLPLACIPNQMPQALQGKHFSIRTKRKAGNSAEIEGAAKW